jgi:hypothetical protein
MKEGFNPKIEITHDMAMAPDGIHRYPVDDAWGRVIYVDRTGTRPDWMARADEIYLGFLDPAWVDDEGNATEAGVQAVIARYIKVGRALKALHPKVKS